MKNLGQMMKQAQQMQAKMEDAKNELADLEIEGASGGGMVKIILSGKHEVKRIRIDPSLAEPGDIEVLEDLITAAFNDARTKVEQMVQEKMSGLMGGLQLPPGMQLPF